jgi:3-mercaptopropionate dioxygenase
MWLDAVSLDFPGRDRLVRALDAATALGDEHAITQGLREAMCELIRAPDVRLPREVLEPIGDHYARRELYVSPDRGYSVVAMTWGPGQGTQIHDHSGLWCVEGIWHGRLEITQYLLAEHEATRFRFLPTTTVDAGFGSAGSLIPPHEFHTIRNPSDAEVTVSLHIYQQRLVRCGVYVPESTDADWYVREERMLGTDPIRH